MTDLAAALLRDVKLYEPDWAKEPFDRSEMVESTVGDWLSRDEVIAALSRALDPAMVERAGELLPDLQISADDGDIDCKEAVSLITTLLAQNAALRVERDALIEWNGQASVRAESAEDRARAAEAEVEKLRGAIRNLKREWYLRDLQSNDFDAALTTEERK